MKKFATLALAFSVLFALAFSTPPAARADSITNGGTYLMTVEPYASGENDGSFYVGYTTIIISNASNANDVIATLNDAYCIDFLHDISVPATYLVQALAIDQNQPILNEQAVLGSQFDDNSTNDIPLQHEIWDLSALPNVPFSLSTAELAQLNAAGLSSGSYDQPGTFAFLEQNGDGQSFMAYNPPSAVPEPSSLFLLGTSILSAAAAFKRRLNNAGR
jgi:hypothetical protein